MKRDINFAHLGNGISVYDSRHEKNGDYERVAHIDRNRVIEYSAKLTDVCRQKIELYAATQDPNISATQDQKVFAKRPGVAARITNLQAGSERYGKCEVCHKDANTTYLLTPFRAFKQQNKIIGITYHKLNSKFGHRECCYQSLADQQDLKPQPRG